MIHVFCPHNSHIGYLLHFCLVLFLGVVLPVHPQTESLDSLAGCTIQDITIFGNQKTRDKIILREMKSEIGSPYAPERLQKDVKRIESLQLFSRVQSHVQPAENDSIRILILVNERWYIFPVPLLLRNEKSWDKWSYGLGLLHENVQGLNHDLIASGWLGFNPGFDIEYKIPWFGGPMNLFAALNVYYLKIKSQNLDKHTPGERYPFEEQHKGFKGYVGKRWGYHFYTSLTYSLNHLGYPDAYRSLLPNQSNQTTASLGFDLTWDTRDLVQYPTSGFYANLYYFKAPWQKVDYAFAGTDLRTYASLGDITLALRAATTRGLGQVPIFAHTFLGYDERIRGHFSEQREGENRLLAGAEIRFPIIPVRYITLPGSEAHLGHYSKDLPLGLNGALFYNTGSVWMQDTPLAHAPFLSGFGVGLNARVPYAHVIRFEHAWNMQWQSEWIIDLEVAF